MSGGSRRSTGTSTRTLGPEVCGAFSGRTPRRFEVINGALRSDTGVSRGGQRGPPVGHRGVSSSTLVWRRCVRSVGWRRLSLSRVSEALSGSGDDFVLESEAVTPIGCGKHAARVGVGELSFVESEHHSLAPKECETGARTDAPRSCARRARLSSSSSVGVCERISATASFLLQCRQGDGAFPN